MRGHTLVLAAALLMTPLDAKATDLVVWWEKGYYHQEDEAVREIVAAFEQGSGNLIELAQPTEGELPGKIIGALEAGQPPDFAFGVLLQDYIGPWLSTIGWRISPGSSEASRTCSIRMHSPG